MATYLVIDHQPGLLDAYLGNARPAVPTGKTASENWIELGETQPAQTKGFSSFIGALPGPDGELIFNFAIGQAAANEYLVSVSRHQIKNITTKTA